MGEDDCGSASVDTGFVGFCFVDLDTEDGANQAIRELNNQSMFGNKINVKVSNEKGYFYAVKRRDEAIQYRDRGGAPPLAVQSYDHRMQVTGLTSAVTWRVRGPNHRRRRCSSATSARTCA